MKKVIYSLILFTIVLLISTFVYADYGIPETIRYTAKVSNENGAESYDGDLVIPYGAEIVINYEMSFDDVVYGYGEYGDKSVYVKLSDIEVVTNPDEINLEEANYKYNSRMIVYKEGAYLYKGPSIIYGKVDGDVELPIGTVIDFKYKTETWGYVEYKGTKGWVYIYTSDAVSPINENCSFAIVSEKNHSHIYTIEDIELKDDVTSNIIIGSIPKGEVLEYKFFKQYPDPHGRSYYIEYNGLKGWFTDKSYDEITNFNIIDDYSNNNYNVYFYESMDVYKKASLSGEKISIPKDSECKLLCYFGDYGQSLYKILYNDEEYWLGGMDEDIKVLVDNRIYYNYEIQYESKKDIDFINFETKELTGEKLPSNATFIMIYKLIDSKNGEYDYIDYNGQKKWIKCTYNDYTLIEDEDNLIKVEYVDLNGVLESEIDNKIVDNNEENIDNVINSSNTNTKANDSVVNVVKTCIVIAVIIAVICCIMILAINKDSKNKKDDNNESDDNK